MYVFDDKKRKSTFELSSIPLLSGALQRAGLTDRHVLCMCETH